LIYKYSTFFDIICKLVDRSHM